MAERVVDLTDDLVADSLADTAKRVVAALCEFAEEQPGNPYDEVSERIYAIAHALEVSLTSPTSPGGDS